MLAKWREYDARAEELEADGEDSDPASKAAFRTLCMIAKFSARSADDLVIKLVACREAYMGRLPADETFSEVQAIPIADFLFRALVEADGICEAGRLIERTMQASIVRN
jgi:hypothetical protein